MNKSIYYLSIIILVFWCSTVGFAQTSDNSHVQIETVDEKIPEFAQRLIRAYPEQQLKYENHAIVFPDGTSILYDDGLEKTFEQRLNQPDLEDMFWIAYPTENPPKYLEDPGRIRSEALFKKMYGSRSADVKKTLVPVSWFGKKIKFTRINGAAEQLQKVADEIAQKHPELATYMVSSGTFYWRKVRHSDRMSAHSYGIAIDIAVKQSDYWKWASPKAAELTEVTYKNRIPMEIVEIFEKHGFVWGGRWYHFDTMHFEYRPEILIPQK